MILEYRGQNIDHLSREQLLDALKYCYSELQKLQRFKSAALETCDILDFMKAEDKARNA